MHEYGLTKNIVSIINKVALEHGADKVLSATIVVGESTSVIPGSLQLYFDELAPGTPAEGATLNVRVVKSEMFCTGCGRNFIRPRFSFECPDCGALGQPTSVGSELYVESVELPEV